MDSGDLWATLNGLTGFFLIRGLPELPREGTQDAALFFNDVCAAVTAFATWDHCATAFDGANALAAPDEETFERLPLVLESGSMR